jgi:Asp-tRNA(Asn)/Glu-tRNA(Gln) amidotransferase A subunit family amidase
MWTAVHAPSVTIPAFRGPNGLPVGAQLIGKRNQDRDLFAAARWVHTALKS